MEDETLNWSSCLPTAIQFKQERRGEQESKRVMDDNGDSDSDSDATTSIHDTMPQVHLSSIYLLAIYAMYSTSR